MLKQARYRDEEPTSYKFQVLFSVPSLTDVSIPNEKFLINCETFSSKFIMHNTSMIKKQAALLSLPVLIPEDEAKQNFSSVKSVVNFDVVTVHALFFTDNDTVQKIFVVICFLEVISQDSWYKFCWGLMHS